MWARFILPHAEHLFSDVTSFNALPAMNRWRFLRYDVFFLGTALRMPSHISPKEGSDGSESEGIASAAKGVGSVRKGCERRCSNGRFKTGRTGPLGLMTGSSACHSGGSGRTRAMVAMRGDLMLGWTGVVGNKLLVLKLHPRPSSLLTLYRVCG
jgi:hypothetical protein